MCSTIGFYAKQIVGIIGSQIQRKKIFFLVVILINLKRCLQLEILKKLIFINKNWPNDFTIGCKSLSSLVELVESDLNLEGKLEKFEKLLNGMKL
jgi:hypothetical protein